MHHHKNKSETVLRSSLNIHVNSKQSLSIVTVSFYYSSYIINEKVQFCSQALLSSGAQLQLLHIYQIENDDYTWRCVERRQRMICATARFVISAVLNPLRKAIWSRNTHIQHPTFVCVSCICGCVSLWQTLSCTVMRSCTIVNTMSIFRSRSTLAWYVYMAF